MAQTAYRTCAVAIGLALLVSLAGCPGPLQPGSAGTATTTETATTDGTATEAESTTADDGAGTKPAATGQLLLAIDGRDAHADDGSATLAAVLAAYDVNASRDVFSYDGERT